MNDKKEEKKQAKKPEKKKLPAFYVKMGKAITTKKGIIADESEIKPEWLAGGEKALKDFIEKGFIGKG